MSHGRQSCLLEAADVFAPLVQQAGFSLYPDIRDRLSYVRLVEGAVYEYVVCKSKGDHTVACDIWLSLCEAPDDSLTALSIGFHLVIEPFDLQSDGAIARAIEQIGLISAQAIKLAPAVMQHAKSKAPHSKRRLRYDLESQLIRWALKQEAAVRLFPVAWEASASMAEMRKMWRESEAVLGELAVNAQNNDSVSMVALDVARVLKYALGHRLVVSALGMRASGMQWSIGSEWPLHTMVTDA